MAKTRVSQGANGQYKITVSEGLAEAMPVLVVAWGVTNRAWMLSQILDIWILTVKDLYTDSLPPLTEPGRLAGRFVRGENHPSVMRTSQRRMPSPTSAAHASKVV